MPDPKSLKEPALRGALNRTPPPSTVPVWDPWHEPEHAEPRPRFKVDPKREPPINGVIPKEIPPLHALTWDPWAHTLPKGVTPPEGYFDKGSAAHSAHVSGGFSSGGKCAPAPETLPPIKISDTVPPLARRMSRLGTETAFDVLARVKKLQAEGKSVVSFALGEPDFDTPMHIRESEEHTSELQSRGLI